MKPRKIHFFLTAASAILLAPAAFAADTSGTWNTTVTPSSWSLDTNWLGNTIADGSGFTANFSTLNPTVDTTVNLDGARTIGNLTFGDTDTSSAASWIVASGTTGPLTLDAGVSSPIITVNALGTNKFANFSTRLEGTNGFTKTGAGALLLNNGTNTISGAVVMSQGNIQLNTAGLTNATTVAINAGTLVVAMTAANAIGGTISFGGGILQYNVSNPATDYSAQFSTAASQQYKINVTGSNTVTIGSSLASVGGTLSKGSTGTLTLAAANTFSGATTVSGGTLQLNNASALQNSAIDTTNSIAGTTTAGLVLNGVTSPIFGGLTGTRALASLFDTDSGNYGSVTNVTLNPGTGASYSYDAAIANGASGMTLTKTGAGTQVLTVASSYTGGTAINGGTLSIGHAAALGTTGTIGFGGGTLQYNSGITTDLSSRFSTAVNQAFRVDTNGQTVTWAGALSSSGGTLTKSGAGILTLTGGLANSFSGAININEGRLNVVDGLSLANTAGTITVASGAAFNYSKNFASGNNLSNALNLSGAGDGSIGALNLLGNVVVTGGITLAADATITHDFNNATIQTGAITGSGRNLQLTTTVAGQFGLVVSSAIQTGAGRVSVTGAANSGAYSVQLGGNNTFTGGLTINNGVVQLNSAGALNSTAGSENAVTFGASTTTGKLALNGRSYTISNLASNAAPGSPVVENGNATAVTLTVGNSQNLSGTYAGALQDGTGGGALSLTKSGNGTLTLSGSNTYAGATLISGGTLRLDATGTINNTSEVSLGSAGTFDVSAKGGYSVGTLKGSGNVTGALTVSTQLAIGNSPGTTNFSSGLTLDSAAYVYEMTGGGAPGVGSADLGNVVGTLTITAGSVLDLVELGTYTLGNKFTLFGYGTLSGTFDGLANNANFLDDLSNTWQIKYDDVSAGTNGGTGTNFVTITAIPEPNTAALLGGLGVLALLCRRR